MEIRAIESQMGGRAEVRAEEVEVGDSACDEHGESGGAGEAREGGALEGVGGEGVGERVHE